MATNSDAFRYSSAFRDNVGVQAVRFGTKIILETELNELQDMQNELRQSAIRTLLPSGWIEPIAKNFSAPLKLFLSATWSQ